MNSLPFLRPPPTVTKVPRQVGGPEPFCDMWEIPGFKYDPDESFEDRDPDMRRAFGEGTMLLRMLNPPPRLGDLVRFTDISRYRNDGVAIWDGEKIIDLETEPDEYGTVPKMFRVIEPTYGKNGTVAVFPPIYWHEPVRLGAQFKQGIIQHNDNVWFDHAKARNDLLQNIRYDTALGNGVYTLYSVFNVNYTNGTIVYGIGMSHNISNDNDGYREALMASRQGFPPIQGSRMGAARESLDAHKIDDQSLRLGDRYLLDLHTLFVNKLRSDKLEAFSLSDINDRFDKSNNLSGKMLWWFYDEDWLGDE